MLIPFFVSAQTFPDSPEPWREAYNISLAGFQFNHPMTVINSNELEIIKQRISSKIEPQHTAFAKLLTEAAVQLNFVPDAPDTMNIMGGYEPNSNLDQMREWLWRNCHAAYTCGLAYALTGDPIYAEKAREVLMNWANRMTTFTGGDRGLQLGSWFSPMLYAADLIHDYAGWTSSERINFKYWWRNNCLIHTIDVMRHKDNNWKDAGLLGVLAAAVVLEDTLLLKEGLVQLKSYFFSRTDHFVQNPGPGWKIKKDHRGVYLPREVVRNDGSSGLTYTAYALTTMTQCLEIARYVGFNFWHDATEEGATLKELIEQYYRWDIENAPFPWHSNPNKSKKRRNCYELANIHFALDASMKNWIQLNRPQVGREGDEYITLNKGDLFEPSAIFAAAGLQPLHFKLFQNYPNPFNSVTTIQYQLLKSSHTKLVIYDLLGQEIALLVDQYQNDGQYQINWNARDLPGGIYFCRLQEGDFSETKKLIVQK
ncbi:MAG: alginate lyase family protein [candidate division KSB1 bacterium]|nr:alginate lyase family protein [candidate division KSB1 bacterium]MDZ7401101.1 alginate lyase family protein [candidate division KSB1 bacterium]